ncbi:MAG: PrsW family intramembrane metalloprotease [Propionibacteriaceae bacterium]
MTLPQIPQPGLPQVGITSSESSFPHQNQVAQPIPGWRPPAADRNKKLISSMVLLVVAGVLSGLLTVHALGNGIVGFLLGILPCTVFLAIASFCYIWLDRWEPEPWLNLVLAFLWGGGIATGFAILVQIFEGAVGLLPDEFAMAVIQAPIAEELGKGSLLFLMVLTIRRHEMNSLVDYMVYAGFVGLGFAYVEDLLYFSRAESFLGTAFMIVIRLFMGIFAHPLFTSTTAFGLYLARKKTGTTRYLYALSGLLLAMACHGTWNGSASFGFGVFISVYFLIMVPLFVLAVIVAINSRKAEGVALQSQLPTLVRQNLLSPAEAAWFSNLDNRRLRIKQAQMLPSGKAGAHALARWIDALTELAFLRQRLDRGEVTAQRLSEHQELMNYVIGQRMAADHVISGLVGAPLTPTIMPQSVGYPYPVASQPQYPVAQPQYPATSQQANFYPYAPSTPPQQANYPYYRNES